jgi:hypothetical protein
VSGRPKRKERGIRKGRKSSVLVINELTRGFVNYSKSRWRREIPLPIAVSVCVFILVRGIEHFKVLVVVEELVEQHKVDSDLRNRLKETEAYADLLKAGLSDINSFLPINARTSIGDSDTGATLRS